MRIKTKLAIILLLLVVTVIINWDEIKQFAGNDGKTGMTGRVSTAKQTIFEENSTEPNTYFCPVDNCSNEMVAWLDAADSSIHCAIFEVGIDEIKQKLVEKSRKIDVKLVTDTDYIDEVAGLEFVREDHRNGFMHNKFCVLDGKAVWTGSFNPTYTGANKNDNNVIFYQSKLLAERYEAEFAELWNGTFGKGKRTVNPDVVINGKKVSAYFCPDDWCANKAVYALSEANHSIYFMTYSFTHDQIGKMVIEKIKAGVAVKGVFEKSQKNNYTEIYALNASGADVVWDRNPAAMHHKVFIIDNSTVVTGSFNPTKSGDSENDENLLIIHDPAVAARYLTEFERVWEAAQLD
jgi:phosphatidylserine/phosphatidylglycerophosphate/cardiolipin synthase-like enzyme